MQGKQFELRLVQNCLLQHDWLTMLAAIGQTFLAAIGQTFLAAIGQTFLAAIGLTFLATIGLTFLPASAQRSGPPAVRIERSGDSPTTKILFIGQSILFAYDTPHIFHAVAKSKRPEETYLIEMVAGGGYSLKDHYEEGTALREIRKERWNYIIIQESTANQIAYHQLFEQYAPFFDQEARKVGAQPFLFECYDDSLNEDCKMHIEVLKVAKMLREPVVPVGSAWRYVRKYYPKMHILGPDFHHPSPLGSYLMACVLYSKIYKEPSEGAMVNLELSSPNNGKVTNLCSTTTPEMKEIEQASWTVVRNLP